MTIFVCTSLTNVFAGGWHTVYFGDTHSGVLTILKVCWEAQVEVAWVQLFSFFLFFSQCRSKQNQG
jgi:hypothetical protein